MSFEEEIIREVLETGQTRNVYARKLESLKRRFLNEVETS